MAVTFANEVEPMPEEARANKPVKKMPKASAWRCTKCLQKGHKRSACKTKLPVAPRAQPLLPSGAHEALARVAEEIVDLEADLRALKRLQVRLGGAG